MGEGEKGEREGERGRVSEEREGEGGWGEERRRGNNRQLIATNSKPDRKLGPRVDNA